MRAERLLVEPFTFLSYLKLECAKELNEHGTLQITGIIDQEKEQEYIKMARKETWVKVKAISESEEEQSFFEGILTGLWIKKENQLSILTIEIKTGSFLLDIESHTRSFQDLGFRYIDVIHTCMEAAEALFILLDRENETTKQFLMQYKETDWEFIKRLSSYMGVVLIPEDNIAGKKVHFDYRTENELKELQSDSYQMEQDYKFYERRKATGKDLEIADAIGYIVRTREILMLGEIIQFKKKKFVIGKVTSWLEGHELYHEYHLITRTRGLISPIYNSKLAGISLKAKVIDVDKTMVQVQIQEDENKENCKSCWFDYATVYSTPDGTGWYCMPEIGDEVRLVIPDQQESHAYVASSVHIGTTGERSNPNEKSWKNRQNKEIMFTPGSIILRNNNGLLIELSDQEGIKIISNKNIIIQSDGNIQMKSQKSGINMSAKSSILMQQGVAKIQMNDAINISGGKIYMN